MGLLLVTTLCFSSQLVEVDWLESANEGERDSSELDMLRDSDVKT
jgi:hypothetical protein